MNASPALFSRRQFLRTASGTGLALPLLLRSGLLAASPNGKLRHACIGVGGMGWGDLQNFKSHSRLEIGALCDVDATLLDRAAAEVPGARRYTDWRELLETEGDRIDSVNVTVPDHMHFAIAYAAVGRGKHVYCQKPMCHDVAEVRALTILAEEKGVTTHLGTQLASGAGDQNTVALLQAGAVGKVKRVVLNANRPGAIQDYRLPGPRPAHGEPPPESLSWDLWLGTAPTRPYAPAIYHPVKWRAWQDFGTGWSGDIGCHVFDAVWKGLGLTAPRTVQAEVQASWRQSAARRNDTWPQSQHITWTFPGNILTESDEVVVEWYDGEMFPPEQIQALYTLDRYPGESAMIVGTEGALLNPLGSMPVLLPEERFRAYPRPKRSSRNHYHHFADACLGQTKTECHFTQSGPMTEAVLLGTVAVRVPNRQLGWDQPKLKIVNHPDADGLLRRRYREGWQRWAPA